MSSVETQSNEIRQLITDLTALRGEMLRLVDENTAVLERLDERFHESGRNLLHYLALRQHDLRNLQSRLASLGLSSLGRAESHAFATVENVLQTLYGLLGESYPTPSSGPPLSQVEGQRLLAQHADELLSPSPAKRKVRIMVTMPVEASENYGFVRELVERGMDCMRINCAHDSSQSWYRMIENLRRVRAETGKSCLVQMDLGGPKLRTGPLERGPAVLKIRPVRDEFGRVTELANIWLTREEAPRPAASKASAEISLPARWLEGLRVNDSIRLVDSRGSKRRWAVTATSEHGVSLTCDKTCYLTPGTQLTLDRDHRLSVLLGPLPPLEQALHVEADQLVVITRDQSPGRPAVLDQRGKMTSPATIGCSIPEVFDDVDVGHAIFFDDGRIGGEIESIDPDRVTVRVTHVPPGGAKLRADKGINLPDSNLSLSAITEKDLQDLQFAVDHADIIGLSFVNRAADVERLWGEITARTANRPAIMLKIETQRGFENLPSILLSAMRTPRCGVMIARGDLAVECGFVRLAEAQEEILWLCEAAHVPVIWATQVLENLAKTGLPSRAEITDAAMGDRAECVMLNKGPHILEAVTMLDDILCRMQSHLSKKQSMLRELGVAHHIGAI